MAKRIDINAYYGYRCDAGGTDRNPNGTAFAIHVEAAAVGSGASIASISASCDSSTMALTNNSTTEWTGKTFSVSNDYTVTVTAVSSDGTYDETVTINIPKGTELTNEKLGQLGVMALWDKVKSFVQSHVPSLVNGHTVDADVPSDAVFTDTTYNNASSSAAGLMSANDKKKLDALKGAYYGTSSTAASTTTKAVTCSNFTLATGAVIAVKFSVTNTGAVGSLQLNVNSTGAKPIKYRGGNLPSAGTLAAGRVYLFAYDGTNWELVGDLDSESETATNEALGQGFGTCPTAAATAAKVVGLANYQLTVGGIIAVKFTYAVPQGATLNVNAMGAKPVYHKGDAIDSGVINAGDVAVFMYNGVGYHLIAVDSWGDEITTAWIDANLV